MASKTFNVRAGRTYRPEEIAAGLGISGKIVRGYLRATYKRPPTAKGSAWVLNAKQARDTYAHFKSRNPKAYAAKQTPKVKRAPKPKPAPAAETPNA